MSSARAALVRLPLIASACLSLAAYAADDRESLFGDDLPPVAGQPAKDSADSGPGVKGFVQFELARTVSSPDHWSKMRARADLNSQGRLNDNVKWKLGVRLDYDAVYDLNDFYPQAVDHNQRSAFDLRENYLDFSAGGWDFRLGRQHVVWGEMVGLFFADVVSARDLREFILPDFDQMRTPQWAARAEYFADDFHGELLWIPVATYDNIGKPGSDFYPYQPLPPGASARYLGEDRPSRNLDNMNYGLRLSTLKNGWDISGFYYRSSDINATFYRAPITDPLLITYQARHDRIHQFGGALTKDFGDVVLKAEAVYTRGRSFTLLDPFDMNGVARQNTVDWALGLDFTPTAETRLNLQFFQRHFFDHPADLMFDRDENGFSLLFNSKLFSNWEAQALFISSINRTDWLFRPRLTWSFERNWRWIIGADIFHGPPLGMFGRYDSQDRVYSEIRYSF
ncbi:MAG: hypothetical protein LBV49_03410 [Azonexus sp.]|jgi:hypothetical protein|nr:hypothetical protein [Azonexus sp.]